MVSEEYSDVLRQTQLICGESWNKKPRTFSDGKRHQIFRSVAFEVMRCIFVNILDPYVVCQSYSKFDVVWNICLISVFYPIPEFKLNGCYSERRALYSRWLQLFDVLKINDEEKLTVPLISRKANNAILRYQWGTAVHTIQNACQNRPWGKNTCV